MKRLKNYTVDEHSEYVLTYKDKNGQHSVDILVSSTDKIEVFRKDAATYVLAWNKPLRYLAMEAFVGNDKVGEVYVMNAQDLEAIVGKLGLDSAPLTMAKRLLPHVQAFPDSADSTSRTHSPATYGRTRTFEIFFDDLKKKAQKNYLEITKREPANKPLAILEIEIREE